MDAASVPTGLNIIINVASGTTACVWENCHLGDTHHRYHHYTNTSDLCTFGYLHLFSRPDALLVTGIEYEQEG